MQNDGIEWKEVPMPAQRLSRLPLSGILVLASATTALALAAAGTTTPSPSVTSPEERPVL
jgi:hypothetical protein